MKRFKTAPRLWLWISLGLFVVPWFLPILGGKGSETVAPWRFWTILFTDPTHFPEALWGIAFFTLLYGVPAVAVGWVLQGLVAIWRARGTEAK
jgi:hypothetical protein